MDNFNKIFQIGFNKCGTTSIHYLFENFTNPKIPSIHWDSGNLAKTIEDNIKNSRNLLTGYETYTSFFDMEYLDDKYFFAGTLYKELDMQYPNSKFILNTRNINNWIVSRLNHKNKTYIERHMSYYLLNQEEIIKKWKKEWTKHHRDVSVYFNNRKNDLLIYNIESDDIGKIKDFFPQIEFITDNIPHVTRTLEKRL